MVQGGKGYLKSLDKPGQYLISMDIRTINITYLSHKDDSSLSSDDLELLEAARAATSLAYAPYSKFFVGATARLTDDTRVRGSNQENTSFPS